MWHLLTFVLAAAGVVAQNEQLENVAHHRQKCNGIYAAKNSRQQAAVEINFKGSANSGDIALVVFDFDDVNFLGVPVTTSDGREAKKYLCDKEAIEQQMCSEDAYGTVLKGNYPDSNPKHDILTQKFTLPYHEDVKYDVADTGYYCVALFPLANHNMKIKANVHFMNSYGHLPAAQYPLLLFHFLGALFYAALLAAWSFLLWRYRHDILPVQKFITGLGAFMVVEQIVLWGYLLQYNIHGVEAAGTKAYLAVVATLGAARLALTFFLILTVAMGYSVVFASLGSKSKWVRILGIATFVSCTLYSLQNYALLPNDDYDLLFLLISLPAVICVGINYVWTLNSLGNTMAYLRARRQHVKAQMYRQLWWILLGSAISIFGFFMLLMTFSVFSSVKDYINNYWRYKWLMSDGVPNIAYFVAFALIMLVWRPTSNNRQYAMSTQLAQDEADVQEFDIGSLDGSDFEADASEFRNSTEHHRARNSGEGSDDPFAHPSDRRNDSQFEEAQFGSDREHSDASSVRTDEWNRDRATDNLFKAPSHEV